MRGSVIDRSQHRQRRMDGIGHPVLRPRRLPLIVQATLLLHGCALSTYPFFISEAAAGVAIGFTSFGLLFYSPVVSVATLSYNRSFQTLSLILRFLVRFDDEHKSTSNEPGGGSGAPPPGRRHDRGSSPAAPTIWAGSTRSMEPARTYRIIHDQHGRPANPTVQ